MTKDDVEEVIARWTGIPLRSEGSRPKSCARGRTPSRLSRSVRHSALRARSRSRADDAAAAPVGSFLFLSRPASAKRSGALVAEFFVRSGTDELLRHVGFMIAFVLDLIGSPPSTSARGGGHSRARHARAYSVLSSTRQKAHPIFNVPSILRDGSLTDASQHDDFKNTTSSDLNIARFIREGRDGISGRPPDSSREKMEEM